MVSRAHEVESTDDLDRLLARRPSSAAGWRLQGLDLTAYVEGLRGLDVRGMVVLGGRLPPALELDLRHRGALVFPDVPEVPFDPYRARLYTVDELYSGLGDGGHDSDDSGYVRTLDAQVYAWSLAHRHDVAATLAGALHDHAIDDALADLVTGHRVVGVMGGHALERGAAGYAAAARLGRALARQGWTVATGGGPGAMEAANLGALSAGVDDDALAGALATVAQVPGFRASVTRWARSGLTAREALTSGPTPPTIGVPTWFYGHEPPNVFASHVAKYFRNALREDTLLHLCDVGIVFLPGAAGTVQEIFQDACENYYADATDRAPMVLVGRRHWAEELPTWPLLTALADRVGMRDVLHLVDSVEDAAEVLTTM
jgi:predicted Rossmann-fold nucleotide-binding protein